MVCNLLISGRVQGVGYRAWTVSQAYKHGLSGWVRNRTDGTVEAVVSGESQAVQAFVAACHTGPLAARVDAVQVTLAQDTVEPGFRALPTA